MALQLKEVLLLLSYGYERPVRLTKGYSGPGTTVERKGRRGWQP